MDIHKYREANPHCGHKTNSIGKRINNRVDTVRTLTKEN